MSKIIIHREHTMSVDELKAALDTMICTAKARNSQVAEADHYWEEDTLIFSHGFGKGCIVIKQDSIDIEASLAFLARPFKSKIESGIQTFLDKHLV